MFIPVVQQHINIQLTVLHNLEFDSSLTMLFVRVFNLALVSSPQL